MADPTALPEEWRPVIDWEGFYEVSDLGRVRSKSRIVNTVDGRVRRWPGRILRAAANRAGGYPQAFLVRPGARQLCYVHRLVLLTFVGRPPEKHVACHFDGNRTNNHLSNLRWGSETDNAFDKVRHGRHPAAQKTHCVRGHLLALPNLKVNDLPFRNCRACGRARSYLHKQKKRTSVSPTAEVMQAVSDAYYAKIMGTAAA